MHEAFLDSSVAKENVSKNDSSKDKYLLLYLNANSSYKSAGQPSKEALSVGST